MDKNHNLTSSPGLTARQQLGLGDHDARNSMANDNIENSLPRYTYRVPTTNTSSWCEDTRRKLDPDAPTHGNDLESSSMMPTIPLPTHQPSNSPTQGYRPEPNPTKVLEQLQRMLEDNNTNDSTTPSSSDPDNQPDNPTSSFNREAWLATRPTIGELTAALNNPRPRSPPPPIPPPKKYNAFTECCLRQNTLCCWPCSDGRDKLPAFEVFLSKLVEKNKPYYDALLDENGSMTRDMWCSSCPVMACDVCCGCLKPWNWGETCWFAHWWMTVRVGEDGRVRVRMPGGGLYAP